MRGNELLRCSVLHVVGLFPRAACGKVSVKDVHVRAEEQDSDNQAVVFSLKFRP